MRQLEMHYDLRPGRPVVTGQGKGESGQSSAREQDKPEEKNQEWEPPGLAPHQFHRAGGSGKTLGIPEKQIANTLTQESRAGSPLERAEYGCHPPVDRLR